MLQTKLEEKIKPRIFFLNRNVYVEKYCRTEQATDDNMAHAHCMLVLCKNGCTNAQHYYFTRTLPIMLQQFPLRTHHTVKVPNFFSSHKILVHFLQQCSWRGIYRNESKSKVHITSFSVVKTHCVLLYAYCSFIIQNG